MKTRNMTIDFFKFYYSFFIVAYHFYNPLKIYFIRGNLAVSFFLIVSGVLLFSSFEKGNHISPNRFALKRLKRFVPSVFISYFFAFIIKRLIIDSTTSPSKLVDYISSDMWEILLLKMNGMNLDKQFFNSPVWTISSIFIVGCIFWCLLFTCKSFFLNCILPVTLIGFFGYYWHQPSTSHEVWNGFTTAGTLRAYIMMGLGFYCYKISEHISSVNFNLTGRLFLTIIELLCHTFVIWSVNTRSSSNYELCNTLMFCISIAIAFSGKSFSGKVFSKFKITKYLAQLSLSIYLVHRPVISLMSWYYGSPEYISKGWTFILCLIPLVFSHHIITKWFITGCRKLQSALKRSLTIQN